MNLTDKLLCPELTQTERLYLTSMAHHEGFPVLQKLFSAACQLVTEDIVRVDPESPNAEKITAIRAQRARNINEFCDAIRKSFNAHMENGAKVQEQEEEKRRENNARN